MADFLYQLFFGGEGYQEPFFWIPLAIGAALGAAKNMEGQQKAKAERRRQAAITRYSPYTGMKGQSVEDPSLMGDIATGTAMGSQAGGMMQGGGAAPQADMSNDAFSSWLTKLKQSQSQYR